MCRNIRTLFNFQPPATAAEIHDASLQFVRKISGFRQPSRANQVAFEEAIEEIAASARRLLGAMTTEARPKDRAVEAERARRRSQRRYPTRS